MKRLNPGFSLHFDIAATIVQILVNRSWCDDYTIWSVCCDECPQQIFTHEVGSQPLCRCPNVIFLIFKFILDHVGYNTLLMVKCLHTFNVQILITSDFMPHGPARWMTVTLVLIQQCLPSTGGTQGWLLMMKLNLLNMLSWVIISSLSTSQKKQSKHK